jgi:hypothetical protein
MKTKLKPASRKVSAKRAGTTVSTRAVVPLRNRRFKVNEC